MDSRRINQRRISKGKNMFGIRKADHFGGREKFGDVFIGSKTLRIQVFTIAERKYNH